MKYLAKTIMGFMCFPFAVLMLLVMAIFYTIHSRITNTQLTEEQARHILIRWFDILMKTSWVFYLIVIIWYLS
jgi:hypothetical protein